MFAPLKRAARAIFQDDIRLRRDGAGLRVVLEESGAPAPPPRDFARLQAQACEREREAVAGMHADLARTLHEHSAAQSKLRHLAYVEQRLAVDGLAMLDKVPLGVLRLALAQFEALVLNWSAEGLACLRSKMAVAVSERGARDDGSATVEDVPSTGMPALLVDEAGIDDADSTDAQAALLAAYGAVGGAMAPPPVATASSGALAPVDEELVGQ